MMMNKIKGNLITLALQGEFDVIAHGLNCFNAQKNGIAADMVKHFRTDTFPMELGRKGDYNKLGQIDWKNYSYDKRDNIYHREDSILHKVFNKQLIVVNCYTQYYHRRNAPNDKLPLINYTALTLCLDKINKMFEGKHIGLPYIGAGLAGGTKGMFELLTTQWLTDCKVTLVEYDGS